MKKVKIKCIQTDKNGVIIRVGIVNSTIQYKKEDFIKIFRNDAIETVNGNKVHVVDNSYLRTNGNLKKDDDLSGLKKCQH
jgi:hypothetical protein